jgi:serine/threonine-protein kinase/endoribonuclease IRE1
VPATPAGEPVGGIVDAVEAEDAVDGIDVGVDSVDDLIRAFDSLEENAEIMLDGSAEDSLLQSPAVLKAIANRPESALTKAVNISSTMLVSLADGKIVALDENTGDIVWTVDTGLPLVMSSKGDKSQEGIFPSTDGALFTYTVDEDGTPSVERLPLKVKDLVDQSPSPTPQGNVVLGSQATLVFIIDVERGLVTKKISGDEKDLFSYLSGDDSLRQETCDVGKEFHEESTGEGNGGASGRKRRKEIAISRKTYVVRSIHPSLGEQWNVTWSKLDKLGIGPTFLEVYGHGEDRERGDLKMVLAPDFSLRRFDSKTGRLMWSVPFEVPPTVAYPAMGRAIDLLEATKELLGMAVETGVGMAEENAGNAVKGNALIESDTSNLEVSETLVVGEIGGNVFGLIAPYFKHKKEAEPVKEVAFQGLEDDSDRIPSTALVSTDSRNLIQVGQASGKACKDGNGMCRIPVGFYPLIGNSTDTQLLFLPKCDNEDLLDDCDGDRVISETLAAPESNNANIYLAVATASTVVTIFISVAYITRSKALQRNQQAFELPNGNTRVGKLEITKEVLGYGSGGTVVFEGILNGRRVAVKRMLKQLVELAKQEIEVLIDSDEHPNIVRCFALEEDGEFIYLALERCDMSLNDALEGDDKTGADSNPSIDAFKVAKDIAEGVNAVHSRGIVHRDLKPHNVLLNASGRAKLSDMGLSKKLVDNQASFETLGAGGSPGWQAPEQLIARTGGNARLTASVDIFSSGMLIYYCLTGGKHPFGKSFDRDGAIMKDEKDLSQIVCIPCALNLIAAMLSNNAEDRPSSEEVLEHPMWWSAHDRLSFLTDLSDRVEVLNRDKHASEYHELESLAPWAIGGSGQWSDKLDQTLMQNLLKVRKYDTRSLRDLLRVVRNKYVHYRELPKDVQQCLGDVPDAFLSYFEMKFPNLVLACFLFAVKQYPMEPRFVKYFNGNKAKGLIHVCGPPVLTDEATRSLAIRDAKERIEEYDESMRAVIVQHAQQLADMATKQGTPTPAGVNLIGEAGPAAQGTPDPSLKFFSGPTLPRKPWMAECEFYMKTGTCKFGPECRFDHPPRQEVELNEWGFPIRPGEPQCNHFSKTMRCKFGTACKYDHSITLSSTSRPDKTPDSGVIKGMNGEKKEKRERASSPVSWRRQEDPIRTPSD